MARLSNHQSLNRKRLIAWSIFFSVFCLLAVPAGITLHAEMSGVMVAQGDNNPRADYWRGVRGGVAGYTAVTGQETDVLIQGTGQNWRQIRNHWLMPYSGYLLAGMLGLLFLYFLIKGRIHVEEGPSGREVVRTTSTERWVHWFTAVVFVLLTLTGLILLYGRSLLIPLMGPEAFAVLADISMTVHNYVGLLFILATLLMIFVYMRDNLFDLKVDLEWFKRAGGYLGGAHPKAGKINAGQKLWYWTAAVMGVVLCVTGVILNFPNFEQSRGVMQISNIIHIVAAAIVIAFFFVHVYLAALGVAGAFQAMVSGKVDENWAKQHHELWYEELKAQGKIPGEPAAAAAPSPKEAAESQQS